jgi:hypothetical protein
VTAGHAIGEAVAAATRNGVAPGFIEIDQADAIAKREPAFDSTNIEAGMFSGNPPAPADNLKTLGFPEYLVARKTSRHDSITTLAQLIYSSRSRPRNRAGSSGGGQRHRHRHRFQEAAAASQVRGRVLLGRGLLTRSTNCHHKLEAPNEAPGI